jgi:3-phenylpropionate/cinnamic acid dioxygenase small subunit
MARVYEVIEMLRCKIEDFLYEESEILDEFRLSEWLDLLDDNIQYRIYIIPITSKNINENKILISNDNKESLVIKVKRLLSNVSWSENPMYQTSRLVTNITFNENNGYINVKSKILVIKSRHYSRETIAAKRNDVLVFKNKDELKIKKRDVTVIGYPLDLKNLDLLL